jgi:hypothetical protein
MRLTRALGAAGALLLAAIVGGTLIGAVAASPGSGSSGDPIFAQEGTDAASAEYCQLFMDTLAAELGVEADALTPAAKTAAISTIESMVANGDLPASVGDRMISSIESAEGDGCALLGMRFHRFVTHAAIGEFHEGMLQAAADALNLSVDEVRSGLQDGSSLEEQAAAQGVDYETVKAAVLDSARDDLAAAVDAGRITQERADRILDRIGRWLDDGGQPGPRRGWHGGPDQRAPEASGG